MEANLRRAASLAVCALIMLSGCSPKSVQVTDAWARPAAAGENSAVYFSIDNPLKEAETLVSVTCDAASQAEVHLSREDNGVMVMEAQTNLTVAQESKVEFVPGGLHVMLIQVKKDLKVGDTINLTLNFERAGAVTVSAVVKEQ